ncbi:MAG TPA: methyl-accepting chemotaxis protein [Nitrospiria bacterium]|nr:methyl-accepting chemotaxis protein [Nitrospiria bacterium]
MFLSGIVIPLIPIMMIASGYLFAAELRNSDHSTEAKIQSVMLIHLGVFGSLIVVGMLVSWFLLRQMTRPLGNMAEMAGGISDWDLTRKVTVESKDELGFLGSALNTMGGKLIEMVHRFQEVTLEVGTASDKIQRVAVQVEKNAAEQTRHAETTETASQQIVSSVAALSGGLEVLSSATGSMSSSLLELGATIQEVARNTGGLSGAVETTTSSVVQMNTSIRETADNVDRLFTVSKETFDSVNELNLVVKEIGDHSRKSSELSEQVRAEAHELGARSIVKTIDGMKNIKMMVEKSHRVIEKLGSSSEEIGTILVVIEEITKQTNLLALNAAILAAQAGEHGKGFAVVADEIQKLSEKTSLSTMDISRVISGIREEVKAAVDSIRQGSGSVEEGLRLSLAAGDAVGKILESARMSADMSGKIDSGAGVLVKGMGKIQEATERMTGMAREIARATREQAQGSEQIMKAAETIREITLRVKSSTDEQLQGNHQIEKAVELVNRRIEEMTRIAGAQKQGSVNADVSTLKIRGLSRSYQDVAMGLKDCVRELAGKTEMLQKEIGRVRT